MPEDQAWVRKVKEIIDDAIMDTGKKYRPRSVRSVDRGLREIADYAEREADFQKDYAE